MPPEKIIFIAQAPPEKLSPRMLSVPPENSYIYHRILLAPPDFCYFIAPHRKQFWNKWYSIEMSLLMVCIILADNDYTKNKVFN